MRTKRRKTNKLLPADASPGEKAALAYFLRDDQRIAFAWWFFCLWCADHKPAFSRQLELLAARAGRPVTHVDGVRVALRFWELSMSSDPAFADDWRMRRKSIAKPQGYDEWGDMSRLINRLAVQEWERTRERVWTDEEKKGGDLWGEMFKLKSGQTLEEYIAKSGLTWDEAGTAMMRASIERDAVDMACAFAMWAASHHQSRIMALADRACGP
jgi:hypothetical protein